ncbi:MAG: hopanoid biosynthesis-associated protein HpnK, partial [Steroidobacteraceae bacterium]
ASMSGYRHADELAALMSPRVRAAVAACGAATGSFRRIAPPPRAKLRAA